MAIKRTTVIVEPQHQELAEFSMNQAAIRAGIDLSVPENKAFFDNMVKNKAWQNAWDSMHHRILNNPVVVRALADEQDRKQAN
jgi:hypothetical protein